MHEYILYVCALCVYALHLSVYFECTRQIVSICSGRKWAFPPFHLLACINVTNKNQLEITRTLRFLVNPWFVLHKINIYLNKIKYLAFICRSHVKIQKMWKSNKNLIVRRCPVRTMFAGRQLEKGQPMNNFHRHFLFFFSPLIVYTIIKQQTKLCVFVWCCMHSMFAHPINNIHTPYARTSLYRMGSLDLSDSIRTTGEKKKKQNDICDFHSFISIKMYAIKLLISTSFLCLLWASTPLFQFYVIVFLFLLLCLFSLLFTVLSSSSVQPSFSYIIIMIDGHLR